MNRLLTGVRHSGRLARDWADFVNRHLIVIGVTISGFFLLGFLLAAALFPDPIPTGDYLFWVFQNARTWPATLWIPYNDHRLVVAKLILHFEVGFLHGNTGVVVALAAAMVIGILFMLMHRISRVVRHPAARLAVLAALCVSLLRGVEILVVRYPSNINHVLVIFFFVAGLSVLFAGWASRYPAVALAALIVLSLCTVGSAANGLAALPVFLVLFHRNFRWKRGTLVFGALSLVVIVAYLAGLRTAQAVSAVLPDPWTIVLFVLNYVGAPWKIGAVNLSNGTYVGAVLTVIVGLRSFWRLLAGKTESRSLEEFALAILLFMAMTGFLIALGRAGLGLVQARSDRFFTGTETMQCATVMLLVSWLAEAGQGALVRRLAMPVLAIAALLMVPSQIRSIIAARQIHDHLGAARSALIANDGNAAALRLLDEKPARARADLAVLRARQLYGF